MLRIRVTTKRSEIIRFVCCDSSPKSIAREIQALYIIIPMITLVVALKNFTFLNIVVPKITAASPITSVPVPADTLKDLMYCIFIEPESAISPLPIARPKIFVVPGF